MKNYVKGTRLLAENVRVSNDTFETGLNNNDIIIGGSGSGKTSGYVSHQLNNPFGSYIVSDTKGLLCRRFADSLRQKGYDVQVLDFVHPEKSVSYNPLRYIRRQSDGTPYESDIKKLSTLLVPETHKEDKFWTNGARRWISMLISYVLESSPEESQNLTEVVRIHQSLKTKQGMSYMDEWSDSNPNSLSSRKYLETKDLRNTERTWFCIQEFVNDALDLFDCNEYRPIFESMETIDFEQIAQEKTVLFLNSSDNDSTFHRMCNIFHAQALQSLINIADSYEDGRLPVPCRMILDDFAATAKIGEFDNLISIIRSREISVSIIIQSISQLQSMYSPAVSQTIINNCDHILYLSGHDPATAQFIATHLNKTPSYVLNLDRSKVVLISAGQGAQILNRMTPIFGCPSNLPAKDPSPSLAHTV